MTLSVRQLFKKLLFSACGGVLVSAISNAADIEIQTRWRIQDNNCPTLVLKNQKWEKTINTLPIGFEITAQIDLQSGGEWILYIDGLKIKAAKKDCFSRIGITSTSSEQILEALTEPPESEEPLIPPRSQNLSVSVFSGIFIWSETLIGKQANGNSLTFESLNAGFRLGAKVGVPLTNQLDFGWEFAGVFGAGEIYSQEITYRASGSHWGAMVTPSLNWVNPEGAWRLGLSTPLYFRRSSWPDPKTGIELPRRSRLFPGLTLHTALSTESWSVMPQIGILGSTHYWILALDMSFRL